MTIIEAQTASTAATEIETAACKALYAFRYNLSLSRPANAKVKAELAANVERAIRNANRARRALNAASEA